MNVEQFKDAYSKLEQAAETGVISWRSAMARAVILAFEHARHERDKDGAVNGLAHGTTDSVRRVETLPG